MKNFYRYKVEPFHWLFTDKLKPAATVRFDLTYSAETRQFFATVSRRPNEWMGWGNVEPVTEQRLAALRSLLPATELAACVAASMVQAGDADA